MVYGRHPFLAKALQNLQAAQLLLDAKLYDAAVTRAYFAAYQAARCALLLTLGRKVDGHKNVKDSFAEELVNRRKVYPGRGGTLDKLMALRHQADYDEVGVSSKQATRGIRKAEGFVLAIQKELEKDDR